LDDVDKLVICGLGNQHLRHMCRGMVDLVYAKCRSRDAIDLGLCVISSPLFVFISEEKKDAFSHALSDICPDCFLPVSDA